ncbi:hypothetical protein B9Z55_020680 [Caenorhabditis nigoni]|uniref:T20D4.11-like domain-containing protein n=1 Tax=Caenorhabditis nigoni TaxID=1611254 RepID=A0A2G5TNM2_9PELO|nr:hypothetical protein B9Z55_020680 [Caenorhabditis nigoni]
MYKFLLIFLILARSGDLSILSFHRNLLGEGSEECFEKFFVAVINEKYECSKEYDFMTKDPALKHTAYTDGQSCVLEIIKGECPEDRAVFLKENYGQLINLLTEQPNDNITCSAPYFQLEAIECNAHKHALQLEMQEQTGEKETHDGAVKVLKMCKDAQECIENSCKFTPVERDEIENSCDVLELTTSDFTVCMNKINREKPDLSRFECLNDHDFYSKDSTVICERWKNKKDCMRQVTVEICGKDVMKSDEKFLKKFLNNLKCDKDNVKKRESFLAGKDCFLRIVQDKCDPDRYDVFNYYYEELVDTLTFIPAHSGCSETYYRLNAQRCYAQKNLMEMEIERQLERHPVLKNSTEVMVMCKNIQECMEGLCFTEDEQSEIEFSLVVPELTVSHFTVCILTIDKELPDLLKYKCLENQSFYKKTPEFLCERYRKSKRECLRAVTQDYCGRDVVKPVEGFLDDFIDLKCKDSNPYTIPVFAATFPIFYLFPTVCVMVKILRVYIHQVMHKKDEILNPHVFSTIVFQLISMFLYMLADYSTIRLPSTGIMTSWCASQPPNHGLKLLFFSSVFFNYTSMLFPFLLSLLRLVPIYNAIRLDDICRKMVLICTPLILIYPFFFTFPLIPALGDCRQLQGNYPFGSVFIYWSGGMFDMVAIYWPFLAVYLVAVRPYGSDCDFVLVPWIFYLTHPIFKEKRIVPLDRRRIEADVLTR